MRCKVHNLEMKVGGFNVLYDWCPGCEDPDKWRAHESKTDYLGMARITVDSDGGVSEIRAPEPGEEPFGKPKDTWASTFVVQPGLEQLLKPKDTCTANLVVQPGPNEDAGIHPPPQWVWLMLLRNDEQSLLTFTDLEKGRRYKIVVEACNGIESVYHVTAGFPKYSVVGVLAQLYMDQRT